MRSPLIATYRWAQRLLLPAPFRLRFGAAMSACLADALNATNGPRGRFRAWRRAMTDLLVTAWRLRRDRHLPRRLHPGIRRPPSPHLPLALRMDQLRQDLGYALRSLGRTPGVAAAAVLTLALGIGANTLIFSLVDGVLLEPLPLPESDRLVALYESNPPRGWASFAVSPANYLDWKRQLRSFQSMTAFYGGGWTLTAGDPARVRGLAVAGDFLQTLGVEPDLGRAFAADEHREGANRVVVLGPRLWNGRLGGDPSIVGDTVEINRIPHVVVGAFTEDPGIPGNVDLYLPLDMEGQATVSRGAHYYEVLGRLADGVDLAAAERELVSLAGRLPLADEGWTARAESLHASIVGDARSSLIMLLGTVGLVLLIACANVANLTLARSTGRTRELGLRRALGAGNQRIFRLVLTESLLISLAGGAAALAVALGGLATIRAVAPAALPRIREASVDGTVLLFTLGLSVLTGLLFGLVPARRAARLSPTTSLKAASPTTAGRPGNLMSALVVAEVALAVIVVVGAGLLLRSVVALQSVDPGFGVEGRITAEVRFPRADYPEPADAGRAHTALLDGVGSLPGVTAVGAVTNLPMTGDFSIGFDIEGRSPERPEDIASAEMRIVAGDYFETLGIPTIQGRTFTAADRPETTVAVVVNEAFARAFFPADDVLGARIDHGWRRPEEGRWAEIVGVVGDVRAFGLGNDAVPVYYLSAAQNPVHGMNLVARVAGPPEAAVPGIRRVLAELDPAVPLHDVRLLGDVVSGSTSRSRFRTGLLAAFASLALFLASVGIYGLISISVASRRREIGVRMAVGAGPGQVRGLVVRDGIRLAGAGIVIGLLSSLALARLLSGFLYGVSPHDPTTLAAVAGFLLAVALAASALPARRATAVDPVTTLRNE